MKKTLKIIFPIFLLALFFGNGNAQSYDSKLSLIMYDSFPGYPSTTPYADSYAGRYRIEVPGTNMRIRITHNIPSTLSDGAGHTIPFSIANNNAAYKIGGSLNSNNATTFNPNSTIVVDLQGNTRITVWLGGTVSPPTNAFPSNNYSGTITITTVIL